MFDKLTKKLQMPTLEEALKGRDQGVQISASHVVLGSNLNPPYPQGSEIAMFGMGCFWGVEKLFWQQAGVHTTAVGYSGGYTKNPSYEEVCSGQTGHNEVVMVVYFPDKLDYPSLLRLFWENHNPTQGMKQGNDRGTQYRSGIYYFSEQQKQEALDSLEAYKSKIEELGLGAVTTEVEAAKQFYFAENYHQQYLAKNPGGYCNMQSIDRTGLPEVSAEKS